MSEKETNIQKVEDETSFQRLVLQRLSNKLYKDSDKIIAHNYKVINRDFTRLK